MSLKDSPEYYHEVLKRIPRAPSPPSRTRRCRPGCGAGAGACLQRRGPAQDGPRPPPGDEIRVMSERQVRSGHRGADRRRAAVVLPRREGARPGQDAGGARCHGGRPQDRGHRGDLRRRRAHRSQGHVPRATPAIAVSGGAIICRMGPVGAKPGQGRRGEEAYVTRRARRDRHAHPPDYPRHRALRGRQLLLAQRAHRAWPSSLSPERGRGATDRGSAGRPGRAAPQDRPRRLRHAHRRPARDGRPGSRPHQHQPGAVATPRHAEELKIKWVEVHHADNPRVANVLAVRAGQGPPRHQQRRRHRRAPRRSRRRGRAHRLQRVPEERRGHPLLDGAAHPGPRPDATVGRPIPRAQFTGLPGRDAVDLSGHHQPARRDARGSAPRAGVDRAVRDRGTVRALAKSRRAGETAAAKRLAEVGRGASRRDSAGHRLRLCRLLRSGQSRRGRAPYPELRAREQALHPAPIGESIGEAVELLKIRGFTSGRDGRAPRRGSGSSWCSPRIRRKPSAAPSCPSSSA